MRKKIIGLLGATSLAIGLLAACSSSPASQLNRLSDDALALHTYAVSASGSITLHQDFNMAKMPTTFALQGTHNQRDGLSAATISYYDENAGFLADLSVHRVEDDLFSNVTSLVQFLLDEDFPDIDAPAVSTLMDADYYRGGWDVLSQMPARIPFLIDYFSPNLSRHGLTVEDNTFTLFISDGDVSPYAVHMLVRPFELLSSIESSLLLPPGAPFSEHPVMHALYYGDLSTYTLSITLTREDGGAFSSQLTLYAPGIVTITQNATYQPTTPSFSDPPADAPLLSDLAPMLSAHRATLELDALLAASGLEVIANLPELHMVDHRLHSELLESFEMTIGDVPYTVSLIAGANNSATDLAVFSYTPSITLFYTALPARSASATIVPFVLEYLDIEDFDAKNFRRTPIRINAHDTAALKALYYDDAHVGRTLHIYLLQNIEDTDHALFLGMVIILENLSSHGRSILNQLGFYIGVDFNEYLNIATNAE